MCEQKNTSLHPQYTSLPRVTVLQNRPAHSMQMRHPQGATFSFGSKRQWEQPRTIFPGPDTLRVPADPVVLLAAAPLETATASRSWTKMAGPKAWSASTAVGSGEALAQAAAFPFPLPLGCWPSGGSLELRVVSDDTGLFFQLMAVARSDEWAVDIEAERLPTAPIGTRVCCAAWVVWWSG